MYIFEEVVESACCYTVIKHVSNQLLNNNVVALIPRVDKQGLLFSSIICLQIDRVSPPYYPLNEMQRTQEVERSRAKGKTKKTRQRFTCVLCLPASLNK